MNKFIAIAMGLLIASVSVFGQTSDAKEIRKERQIIRKMSKAELTSKVDKVTKKEAKRLKKEGWIVSPGAPYQ